MERRKLIFLDIDGVLNNCSDDDQFIHGYSRHFGKEKHFLNRKLIDNFNFLVKYTKSKVVVSSTWRLGETIESMQKLFDSVGIDCEVVGLTGRSETSIRGIEILEYIKNHIDECYHMYSDYVILDDDTDMLLWQKDNFVHTDCMVGLTKGDVWKAINILNRNMQ